VSWLRKIVAGPRAQPRRSVPDGVWLKCAGCGEILYRQELERHLWICTRCSRHFRIPPEEYIAILCDEGTFRELFQEIRPTDPLHFRDGSGRYSDRLKRAQGGDERREAVITGRGAVDSIETALAVMDFSFLGGSMGSVVGERIARLIDLARTERLPLVIISCSGGARMHEGILSLMQMAKTCTQLGRLAEEGVPFLSILTDPTTGGVSASFAMLGDVILAEPGALIGFAGPRVIRETIRQDLPEGFQSAEFLRDHGFVDQIVGRDRLRATVVRLLTHFADSLKAGGQGRGTR
jgi:acetyl-CoA carboxylase carboxyl transferase subunit beta